MMRVGLRDDKMAEKTAVKRAGYMAVHWVVYNVGRMADCWAERMAVMRVCEG